MPTECSPVLFDFLPVEGRQVVASFDGGAITSDAGALLLSDPADRAVCRLLHRHPHGRVGGTPGRDHGDAACRRHCLGYEDLNDHDELRHDPVLAVLAGKLEAQRSDCAPLAGKSSLNRLELSRAEPTRYHKVSHDPASIESLFVDLFLDAHRKAPKQIILDLDATGRKLRPGLCPGPAKGIALGTNQAVITHRPELPSPDEPVATLKE
jgi:Transposase DDE domain group 1